MLTVALILAAVAAFSLVVWAIINRQKIIDWFRNKRPIRNPQEVAFTLKSKIANGDLTAGADINQIKKTYSLLGIFTKNAEEFVKNYEKSHAEPVPEEISALANEMQSARQNKDYQKADALRAEIIAKGYTVMISKDGVTVKKA